jgi:hypothetical protein
MPGGALRRWPAARTVAVAWLGLMFTLGVSGAFAQAQPNVAQLQAGAPDVIYQPPGMTAETVPTDDTRDVRAGDSIDVSEGGFASLQFPDSLRVQIFHDSQLRIEGSLNADRGIPLVYYFSLLGGTIFGGHDAATVAQHRLLISTPSGVTIQPLGTQFLAYYDPINQRTWVVVSEGMVRVSAAGVDRDVSAGFQTWVEAGQAPEPLLPADSPAGGRFPLVADLTDHRLLDADLLLTGRDALPSSATRGPAPDDAPLCGPENPDAAEPPRETIVIGQPMRLSWRLCYMWRAVERGGYHPDHFVGIRRAFLKGYPVHATSPEVPGPPDATEATLARIQAFSGGYDQRVEIEMQIQFEGDFIDWRSASVIETLPPNFARTAPVTFAGALQDAQARGLLPSQ